MSGSGPVAGPDAGAGEPSLPASALVVGSGLIGTSVALGLRRRGVPVWLEDVDPASLEVAVDRGAGLPGPPDTPPELVIVAVPPRWAPHVITDSLRRYVDATVSDVASTKAELQREVEAELSRLGQSSHGARFVPGHPLAGREVSGPAAARADLFQDRVWALTPTAATDPARTASLVAVVEALGAVPLVTSPEEHDRAVALTSHTPQVVSSALAAALDGLGDGDVRLSGQGLRDVTRLASSDPGLWTEILTSNAGPVSDALDALMARLAQVRDGLRHGRDGDVRDALAAGVEGRRRVQGKHGSAPVEVAVVSVSVPDRPGELGRLFADAGATGVNLEDARIDHAQGRPTGLVELEVAREAASTLSSGLRSHGWDVRS